VDYTVVEVKIICAICGNIVLRNLKLEKNQESATTSWECPDCHAQRIVTVRKKEAEESIEEEKEPIKNFIEKDGRRIQVDENGDPIEKSGAFMITTPKRKERKTPPVKVSRME